MPLRFHCIKTLLLLAEQSDVHVPVAPLILDALDFKEVRYRVGIEYRVFMIQCR